MREGDVCDDGTPRICELRVPQGHRGQGACIAPAALDLHHHAPAPVAELHAIEILSGVHVIADLTLGLGKVVRDYLR